MSEPTNLGKRANSPVQEHLDVLEKSPEVARVEATSAALALALADSGKLSTRSFIRLYIVMAVGYLVSTIQGYG